ncbi:hypothetical protein Tco_0575832 [Tanacetum coccineum]
MNRETINVENRGGGGYNLLVKLKDIDSMDNRLPCLILKSDERILWIEVSVYLYVTWCSMAVQKGLQELLGKFLFFEKEESTALSSVDIKNESFLRFRPKDWIMEDKIKDDYNDISSNHDLKERDHVSESNDEQPIDDFEILQTKLNNMDEQAFDNELGTKRDKKDGENRYSIDSPKKKMEEDTNFNFTNSETKDNPSDLSRPPGFEFMKKCFSSSSNYSTSFARRRKNGYQRIFPFK